MRNLAIDYCCAVGALTIQVVQLFLHEEATDRGLDELGHALGGDVGAMGSAEGVIDVDVSVGGHLSTASRDKTG